MKTHTVVFAREAQQEALEAAAYIAETSPLNARRWYHGLEAAILSLASFPRRCK